MLSLEKLPHRSHFPPEDMRFNDSLRWCRWNRDTDSMFTTHAISKQRGGGGFHIKLVLYDKVMIPLYLILVLIIIWMMKIEN